MPPGAEPPPRPNGRDLTEADWSLFRRLTSVELDEGEQALAAAPNRTAPGEPEFLAVHWHPEWIPLSLVGQRLRAAFPEAGGGLAIPTQHNKVMCFGPWAGVEADAYDREYGQKVQLLIHFRADRLARAGTFVDMMERTYNYRAHQLLDILGRLAAPGEVSDSVWPHLKSSVSPEGVEMARFYAIKLQSLIRESGILGSSGDEMLKNRLLPDFMQKRVKAKQAAVLEQALLFVRAVKKSVKAELRPEAFYSPRELIEEARSFGAGVVIPHPPLFWPILLSDLDVDGWEVWNPSTPGHAVFLAEALARANGRPGRRELLVFMGDDTHMSSKIRQAAGDKKAGGQEIGFQEAWLDPPVADVLRRTGQSRARTISEYRDRLLA